MRVLLWALWTFGGLLAMSGGCAVVIVGTHPEGVIPAVLGAVMFTSGLTLMAEV